MPEMDYAQIVERTLMKTYKGPIYSKFIKAIDEYELIQDGDRIAVALSGGKDSLLLAKLFQAFKKYGHLDFEVEYFTMDPGYEPKILEKHKENCNRLGIPIRIFPSGIFRVAYELSPEKPCFLCARMRRGFLYKTAQELGCNKLALGHHFDDVIETTLLNIIYAGSFKTMLPKAKSRSYDHLELIRPMYLIKESDCIRFTKRHNIEAINCGCKVASMELDSKRKEIKRMIEGLRKQYVNSDINIFRSAENVNINSILGYHDESRRFSFLDRYNDDILDDE